MQIQKLRGVDFVAGYHDLTICKGGLEVYPRLIAAHHHKPFLGDPTPSGVAEMDALLGGGPMRGTSTLISGPAGAGKTTLALQYVHAACEGLCWFAPNRWGWICSNIWTAAVS